MACFPAAVRVARVHGRKLTGDPCGRLVACQTARSLRDATISHARTTTPSPPPSTAAAYGYSSAAPMVDYVVRDILSGRGTRDRLPPRYVDLALRPCDKQNTPKRRVSKVLPTMTRALSRPPTAHTVRRRQSRREARVMLF